FIQAGQSAKKTFTAALKPVEYHELLNKYEIFFLKNSKIFARYFRKHATGRSRVGTEITLCRGGRHRGAVPTWLIMQHTCLPPQYFTP
ncbi:MAG: hypothetical protein IJ613_03460, partial [Muribaculaceae bacterium]|nr:hypothetical protein [Muribaculaceae bacterium]